MHLIAQFWPEIQGLCTRIKDLCTEIHVLLIEILASVERGAALALDCQTGDRVERHDLQSGNLVPGPSGSAGD